MKYFRINELARCFNENGARCRECRLKQPANKLPDGVEENLQALVDNVLDPVRERYGKPIKVNSGFRCLVHNKTVGGVPNSQHMKGEAADIVSGDSGQLTVEKLKEENRKIAQLIVKNGKFDQLILENVGEYDLLPQWVHVSYNPRLNRGMVLKKVVGKAGYPVVTTEEICRLLGGNFRGK